MRKKQKKQARRPRWASFLFMGVVAYLAIALFQQEQTLRALDLQEAEQGRILDQLEAEIADIQNDLDQAETNAFIEKLARQKLGLVKPGEITYIPDRKPGLEQGPKNEEAGWFK